MRNSVELQPFILHMITRYQIFFYSGEKCSSTSFGLELSGVLMMAFVGSAVTPKLNRRGHSFVWGLCQSPDPLQCLAASSLSPLYSTYPPLSHPPTPNKISETTPTPCWDQEELAHLTSPVYPLSEHAFLEGRLLFIPSGGLTVNLLHWGKFLGVGPICVLF